MPLSFSVSGWDWPSLRGGSAWEESSKYVLSGFTKSFYYTSQSCAFILCHWLSKLHRAGTIRFENNGSFPVRYLGQYWASEKMLVCCIDQISGHVHIYLTYDRVDVGGVSKTALLLAMMNDSRDRRISADEGRRTKSPQIGISQPDQPYLFLPQRMPRMSVDSSRYDEEHGVGALQELITRILRDTTQMECVAN
jgi:hypothetical protein